MPDSTDLRHDAVRAELDRMRLLADDVPGFSLTARPDVADPPDVLAITTEMPDVDADAGENWAEVAFAAWAAYADDKGVVIEELYTDCGEWVGDGRTVAQVRIGAEWYLVEVEPSTRVIRPVFAR